MFVNCHFLRVKPYGKVKHFFMKDVMETNTGLILVIAWKAEVVAEEESEHQRSGMRHRKSDGTSSVFLGFLRSLPVLLGKRVLSSLALVWICPLMAEQLLFSEATKHENNIFAHDEHIWANTIIFLCPACSNSQLLLTWRGRDWRFSVWNASWDEINAIDFILPLQRAGIFPFIFFFSLWLYSLRSRRVKQRHWVLPAVFRHRGQGQSCRALHEFE